MRSTFMGLETSKRGLFTQQSALYTTGNNISNANTEGYTRQRVNLTQTLGYPGIGLNTPKTAGFIGTGVDAESVQRIRDEFIDRQYRQETNNLGYWDSRTSAIEQMEDVLTEPSDYGLNQSFNQFWNAMQDVSTNPSDTATRAVAIQKAEALADSFNYLNTQLETIQGNLGNEIKVATSEINSILKQIADLNRQVQAVEPNGYVPNDLYDARDLLVDQLNEYIPVSVERVHSGGNVSDVAEGSYTIKFTPAGSTTPIKLVDGREYASISVEGASGQIDGVNLKNVFEKMNIKEAGSTAAAIPVEYTGFEKAKGKLLGLIDSYGYKTGGTEFGYYPEMMKNLDKVAEAFVTAFNEVHSQGYTLGAASTNGINFFEPSGATKATAATIKVNSNLINNPELLAASSAKGEEGNGNWALLLANLQYTGLSSGTSVSADGITVNLSVNLNGGNFQSYYEEAIGQLGVDGQQAARMKNNSETLQLTIENNRSSMSSVSLDEEMTNMITFQQAYNANARMITVVDEMLDKIINGMGRVGL